MIKDYNFNLYDVNQYDDSNSVFLKYKGTDLYLLPLMIYPHELLEKTDEHYLNYRFSLLVSPFQNILQIDMYNNKFFRPASRVLIRLNDTPNISIDCSDFQPHNEIANPKYLFNCYSL